MMRILYRCCNRELDFPPQRAGRPNWFSKINCFKSLIMSYNNSKFKDEIKIYVLMQTTDGNPSSSILEKTVIDTGCEILFHKGASDLESKTNQLLFYKSNFSNDFVYFVEDDYLHSKEALDCIYTGVKKFGLVTGYDHYDRYSRDDDLTYGKELLFFHEGRHWRTAESTTNTWAASPEIMKTVTPYCEHYGIGDRIFFRHIYYEQKIRLHQPIPGVSTHAHEPYMSPGVNWQLINEESSKI
jgi:hypothetical protein